MSASFEDVERWKKEGIAKGAAFIISMCDTFDYDDYPVFVMPGESISNARANACTSMQTINETIDLTEYLSVPAEEDTAIIGDHMVDINGNEVMTPDDPNYYTASTPIELDWDIEIDLVETKPKLKDAINNVIKTLNDMSARELVAELKEAKEDPKYEAILYMLFDHTEE